MTSTQRSESANHMLKGYVPPGCPMHLFIRQYEKLQSDRESEESIQEKRTALSGVPLRLNIPIERQASKIYTRSMFEQFSEALYKSFAHQVDVIEDQKVYKVTHLDAAAWKKWSKVVFIVNVDDEASFFDCECGTFEHSGMVCCHSLKVIIEFRLAKIPDKHIVKRWTRDARDILPDHLARYQKDRGPPVSDTFRHNQMWIRALECVRLGDSNVKCYDVFMAMMKEVYVTLLPLSHDKDGMGLEERDVVAKMASGTVCSGTVVPLISRNNTLTLGTFRG